MRKCGLNGSKQRPAIALGRQQQQQGQALSCSFFEEKMKAGFHVPRKSGHQQQAKSIKPVVTSILKKVLPTFLDDDLDFGNNLQTPS